MKKELDNKLCKDFPNLYRDRRGNPANTAMCWGFPGNGWHGIIRRLSEKLEAAILALPPEERETCCASQVKEKYGVLEFYMTNSTDQMEEWIGEARSESSKTCETCGGPGELDHKAAWIKCICKKCETVKAVLKS